MEAEQVRYGAYDMDSRLRYEVYGSVMATNAVEARDIMLEQLKGALEDGCRAIKGINDDEIDIYYQRQYIRTITMKSDVKWNNTQILMDAMKRRAQGLFESAAKTDKEYMDIDSMGKKKQLVSNMIIRLSWYLNGMEDAYCIAVDNNYYWHDVMDLKSTLVDDYTAEYRRILADA